MQHIHRLTNDAAQQLRETQQQGHTPKHQCLPRTQQIRHHLDLAYEHTRQGIQHIMTTTGMVQNHHNEPITQTRHNHDKQHKTTQNGTLQQAFDIAQRDIQQAITHTKTIQRIQRLQPKLSILYQELTPHYNRSHQQLIHTCKHIPQSIANLNHKLQQNHNKRANQHQTH
jgi:hypothetical protein